eukprot:359306-Chlamydomonas_euryale.AAC.5
MEWLDPHEWSGWIRMNGVAGSAGDGWTRAASSCPCRPAGMTKRVGRMHPRECGCKHATMMQRMYLCLRCTPTSPFCQTGEGTSATLSVNKGGRRGYPFGKRWDAYQLPFR